MRKINCGNGSIITNRENEMVRAYLNDIRKYAILSADEQKELCRKAQSGDNAARNMLITSNLRYMFSVCVSYANNDALIALDYIAIATIAMNKAIDNYNIESNFTFISFAGKIMQSDIWHCIQDDTLIRNKKIWKISGAMKAFKEQYYQIAEREPSNDEVVAYLESEGYITAKDNDDTEKWYDDDDENTTTRNSNEYIVEVANIASFSDFAAGSDEDATLEECGSIAVACASKNDCEEIFEREDKQARINAALAILEDKERKVLTMCFGLNGTSALSVEEIAQRYGVSAMRIFQIRKSALDKLRTERGDLVALLA